METYYLLLVVLLVGLAIFDLIVGVANDAVNFLNSAIGAKASSMRTIMIVATIGIFLGAVFSGGMMEVARKGIFHPNAFMFSEIMVIFMAVMLTDIILLDLFNTFGMPTSTTVSIVFELLGASVAVGVLKIMHSDGNITHLVEYINYESAISIVSGIFLSVGVAFIVGTVIMFFSRLLFSFREEKQYGWLMRIWGALALMAMSYFLLIKGLKNAPFIDKETSKFINSETTTVLAVLFVFWAIVLTAISYLKNTNILKFVVLFGTFALAMAFASNDLVNFIGVPVAGFESFSAWRASGQAADQFSMAILAEKIQTNTMFLVLAGIIMAATLWLSKKARSVTETEVNLGRQDAGYERFRPSGLARSIVRGTLKIVDALDGVMPQSWSKTLEKRFETVDFLESDADDDSMDSKPAFDLVRASVNLAGASVIIAIATSMKQPLSTTFVSFMVAMGTSLADKAWGRDSAVYRVSGVLNVIGGWLFTALAAFTSAAVFASLIYFFGGFAVAALVGLAVFLIYRTYHLHKKEEEKKRRRRKAERNKQRLNKQSFVAPATAKIGDVMRNIHKIYNGAIDGAINEDRALLKKTKTSLTEMRDANEELGYELQNLIKNIDDEHQNVGHAYLRIYNIERDLVLAARNLIRNSNRHVHNLHTPIQEEQKAALLKLRDDMNELFAQIKTKLESKDFSDIEKVMELKKNILKSIDKTIYKQIEGIRSDKYDPLNSRLMFGLLSEMKDVAAISARFAKLFNRNEMDEDIDWEW